MEKWKTFIGYNGTPRITVDNEESTPIARLSAYNDWAHDPETRERVLRNANLLAAAPEMLHALEIALFAISVEDVEAYDIVQKAIKTAKGGQL